MTENIATQKCRLLHNINFVGESFGVAVFGMHFFQLNSGPEGVNPFVLSYVYIRTKSQNRCDSCTYIHIHGLRDRNMGLYRRLKDTLRYHPTRCSRDFGLLLAAIL